MPETVLDYDDLNEDYFDQIADILLNHTYLLVNKKKYRLVEIEFYLNSNAHKDEYTHSNPDQLLMHTFYFHKYKTGTHKAGTYKGMDLTFGDAEASAYFGILVRAIKPLEKGDIIEGPCKTVDQILKDYGVESILDLTRGENLDLFNNRLNFILVPDSTLDQQPICAGPRIGLSAKFPEYQNRPYRYVIYRDRIKKQKTSLIGI